MNQIATALQQANPKWNKDTLLGVRPLHDHIVGARTTQWMLMLLGAVGIVLLIACANVANLLLARASEREREVGIRAALGAGRWQLMRQLMTENLVLAVAGDRAGAGPRVVGRERDQDRDSRRRAARQQDRDRSPRAGRRRVDRARHRHALRHRAGVPVVSTRPHECPEGGRAWREHRPRPASPAQCARRRRSRARGRVARGRRALHRQLPDADAHRSGVQPGPRADREPPAAIRSARGEHAAAKFFERVRPNRRADQQHARRDARLGDFRWHAARRQHEHHVVSRSRAASNCRATTTSASGV